MLFETRKVLIGFRLKLSFDSIPHKNNSCVFVDVLKTPTVGLLLNNIIERFQLPHDSSLSLENCKLLNSESIYVLVDVNTVKIIVPPALENGTNENSNVNLCSSIVPFKNSNSKSTEDVVPLAGSDVVDGKSDVVDGKTSNHVKPRAPKKPFVREGIAATIRKLLEEEEINNIGRECSAISISNDVSKSREPEMNQVYPSVNVAELHETSLPCTEISDLNSDAFDVSDLSIDKKKRKRKRKHAKNISEDKCVPSFSGEPIREWVPIKKDVTRQHIHFSDMDDDDNLNPPNNMETDNLAYTETNAAVDDCGAFKEMTETRGLQPPTTFAVTCPKPKESQYPDSTYKRPKSSLSIYSGRISKEKNVGNDNNKPCSQNLVSSFISLPKLSAEKREQNKPKCDQVEKELSTLLMCKQLDTCMQYTVQYANEKNDSYRKLQSPLNRFEVGSINSSSTKSLSPLSDLQNQSRDCRSTTNLVPAKLEFQEKNDFQSMEESSNDCQVLQQVKVDGGQIRLCRSDGTWTVLTPEMANVELTKLATPKENQSIVFRIVYLNQKFCPVLSDLLYGQIVRYRPDTSTLAIDIPFGFIQAILDDCGGESLPEALSPITGTTFEVHLSTLVDPKVIS